MWHAGQRRGCLERSGQLAQPTISNQFCYPSPPKRLQCADFASFPSSTSAPTAYPAFQGNDALLYGCSAQIYALKSTSRVSPLRLPPIPPISRSHKHNTPNIMSDQDALTPRVFLVRHGKFYV